MRNKCAFTLIEILIVIAVILIIAAIVVPVIMSAKRSAKTTVDVSNLRQIGQAAAIYAASNDDIQPLTVFPLIDSGLISNAEILRSPLDTTEFGFSSALAEQMEITDLERTDYFVSYPGVRHYALDREFYNDVILQATNPGWLVNVMTTTFSNDLYYFKGLGKYQRLMIDGSVQTRHMDYVDAFLPDSGSMERVFSGSLYFVDEGGEWLTANVF